MMKDEFKEAAEDMANRWKQHRDRWREDANIPRAIKCRLDALVAAMPDPKDELCAAAVAFAYDLICINDVRRTAIYETGNWNRFDGAIRAYKQSKGEG